jgi:hypothetical protein
MKKVFALLAVCGFVVAFVACGGKKTEEAAADSVVTETPVAVDTTAADTTAADSAAVN